MVSHQTGENRDHRMTVVVTLLAILMMEALVFAWCRHRCVQIGYETTREMETKRSLTALENNLRVELSRLRSPERIATLAREQLGLTLPNPERMYILP
jgi:cell division protein FtsL